MGWRANLVPLVLIPLAAVLLWVAIWRVWLPPAERRRDRRDTVTTVNANAPIAADATRSRRS